MDYTQIITMEPGKRSGKPCIRGLRITVADVLGYLAAGMSQEELLSDFPELTQQDILACLAFAADRVRERIVTERFFTRTPQDSDGQAFLDILNSSHDHPPLIGDEL
ncbi:MAG TPA: DUF433 domain-containing protein [Acidobacteriaceae bacterium]